MAIHHFVLFDADKGIQPQDQTWSAEAVGGVRDSWRVTQHTLRGGRREGVMLLELDNGRMRLGILPTRGMGIWKGWMGDHELGWQSPVCGPVHPSWVPVSEPSGLGWLEGFDELMCRCGLQSNGAPQFDAQGRLEYPLHGRIANLPADRVELEVDDVAGTIAVTGIVEESRFHFYRMCLTARIVLPFESATFSWFDQVQNCSGRLARLQMLYHFNIGPPILGQGAQLFAPVKMVVPRDQVAVGGDPKMWSNYPPPSPGSNEQVFFLDLLADAKGETEVLLHNQALAQAQGVALRYNRQQLPCFTQWRNTPALQDGYVTGLEPGTNYPNPYRFETQQGRVIELGPDESWQAGVSVEWMTSAGEIRRSSERIRSIQGEIAPTILSRPASAWSPGEN